MVALTNATKVVKIVKGTAKLSEDATVNKDKVYYAQTNNGYIVGTPKANPKTEGFYENA